VNREAKTILLRTEHSKNKESRMLPLSGELAAIVERRWQVRGVKNEDGSTGIAKFVFHCGDGRPVGDFRKAWATACSEAKMPGILFHDLRRSAVRNLDRSGVGQAVAMKITGHKTLSVYQRYRIVSESDIRDALDRAQAAIATSKECRVIAMTAEAK
jgi:integrase